jgi:cytochrome c oxidase cbb3-type subunit 3
MRHTIAAAAAALLVTSLYSVSATARAPQGPPQQGGGRGRGTFPAQQRELASPEVIERGNTLYGINCRLCHGPDLRGGDLGGVNLLRSAVVLGDKEGELIYPIVHNGVNKPGQPPMPPFPLSEDDVKAIAAYIHSVTARMAGQGGPPPGPAVELDILVGNAAAGQKYFAANCATCHAADGDLKGIASRYATPVQLQNAWVAGGGGGGRGGRGGRGGPAAADFLGGQGGPAPRVPKPVTVAVTTADGQKIEGRLDRIDDFLVTLIQADGTSRTFRRNGNTPAVQITDPLEGHKQLLVKLTDKDMHDVTATW